MCFRPTAGRRGEDASHDVGRGAFVVGHRRWMRPRQQLRTGRRKLFRPHHSRTRRHAATHVQYRSPGGWRAQVLQHMPPLEPGWGGAPLPWWESAGQPQPAAAVSAVATRTEAAAATAHLIGRGDRVGSRSTPAGGAAQRPRLRGRRPAGTCCRPWVGVGAGGDCACVASVPSAATAAAAARTAPPAL